VTLSVAGRVGDQDGVFDELFQDRSQMVPRRGVAVEDEFILEQVLQEFVSRVEVGGRKLKASFCRMASAVNAAGMKNATQVFFIVSRKGRCFFQEIAGRRSGSWRSAPVSQDLALGVRLQGWMTAGWGPESACRRVLAPTAYRVLL